MSLSSARRAFADSAVCLLLGVVALAAFVPPWAAATSGSLPRTVLAALTLALAVPLHWVFLAIGARRLGQPPRGWMALAVLLFPLGGAAALILLAGLEGGRPAQPTAAR